MPVQAPLFGKIIVQSVQRDADGSELYRIRLTDEDRGLAPIPDMGDRFVLRVAKGGDMQAHYKINHKSIGWIKRIVRKDDAMPLIARMAENASFEEWKRLLAEKEATPFLVRRTFPAITFEDRFDGSYREFAGAFRSTRDKLGLHDKQPVVMPFLRKLLTRLEQIILNG